MTRNHKLLISLTALVLIFACLYTTAWFYAAGLIRLQLQNLYTDAARAGVTIDGAFPSISGFPGPHRVTFSGKIAAQGQTLDLPRLEIRGLFLPGRRIVIDLPQGAALEAGNPALLSISSLTIKATIPVTIPASLQADDLLTWQRAGGQIVIDRVILKKDSLALNGTGTLSLDDNLQPTGALTAKITGAMDFLDELKQQKLMRGRDVSLAQIVLIGLSQTDKKTGEHYMQTMLSLKNQTLYVGPLSLLTLPALAWPSHHPPAPPQ
jgi:hypothetical protein